MLTTKDKNLATAMKNYQGCKGKESEFKAMVTFLNWKAVRITTRKQDVSLEKTARLPTIEHLELDLRNGKTQKITHHKKQL